MIEFSDDPNAISSYLGDESSAFTGNAERVYFPTSAEEVLAVFEEAERASAGVTVSGGGTSITGARVPTVGGWILATDRMTSVTTPPGRAGPADGKSAGDSKPAGGGELSEHDEHDRWQELAAGDSRVLLDAENRRIRVPAGLRMSELDAVLEPHGLFYPPTLTEMSAMIGGTIATNASGAHSFHYGATRRWVEALEVVTPRGDHLRIRRGERAARDHELTLSGNLPAILLPEIPDIGEVKNAAGYFVRPGMDAVDLFIGGEGTLGVVTEAELRLAPRLTGALTLLLFAAERDRGLDFADAVRDGLFAPWTAVTIEYFDRNALDFMRQVHGEIPQAEAAVLVEVAPPDGSGERWFESGDRLEDWLDQCAGFSAADTWVVLPTEREQIRLFRHALPDRVNDYVRTRSGKLGTDLAVPAGHFRAIVNAYDEAASAGIRTVLFGHLGEYHLHLNFLADDADQMTKARTVYAGLAKRAVELGGTVSAEHGVGKKTIELEPGSKVPYIQAMVGPDGIAAMAELKRQLDPGWILNRGTLLPWGNGS